MALIKNVVSGVSKRATVVTSVIVILVLSAIITVSSLLLSVSETFRDLLLENKKLKKAISNLTNEEQIGYAKVIQQQKRDGKLYTTFKFVQTAPGNKLEQVHSKEYEIDGDVIFFDALIITFDPQLVMDGKKKAMYIWRRVYGETMAPSSGYPIEAPGNQPARYKDFGVELSEKQQDLFWTNIWRLANDTRALEEHGIKAVYGNAIYNQLQPGLIYVFKISGPGQVVIEAVPDI